MALEAGGERDRAQILDRSVMASGSRGRWTARDRSIPIIPSATSRTTRPRRSLDSPASACRPRSSGRQRPRGSRRPGSDAPTPGVRRHPIARSPISTSLSSARPRSAPTRSTCRPIGCRGMIGDVWEWTSSDFGPWPGFQSFPYREYSEVFFGPEYKVLRGGSWATRPGAVRNSFRNWDYPIRRQIFSGFRCARDALITR